MGAGRRSWWLDSQTGLARSRKARGRERWKNGRTHNFLGRWQRPDPALSSRSLDRSRTSGIYIWRKRGCAVIVTNFMVSWALETSCGSLHYSKVQNRGACPECLQALSLTLPPIHPKHHFKTGLSKTLLWIPQKQSWLSTMKDWLLTQASVPLLARHDQAPRQNLQWPHQPFFRICFTLNSSNIYLSSGPSHVLPHMVIDLYVLFPPTDHKYLEARYLMPLWI